MKGQTNLLDEIIVDNFAGGGGASTGMELATGRPVAIAINHDPDAILMHKTNHPYTMHYQASVWDVDPEEVCQGRDVGLAWFSPDCKHFSKAKGSALVDRNIRGLAWIVLRWAAKVRPRVIILENVEEFQTWGPVRKGKPVKSKSGETFKKWKQQLTDLGYEIDHRELVAADYGTPTIRKRFVLVARCDGKPIVWPERTHAPRNSEEVKRGELKPWVSAAEIIDWSLPCYSIFESKEEIKRKYGVNVVRPLKENTLRRIARGIDKFVLKDGNPFIVPIGYGEAKGQLPRVHNINDPVSTIVASAIKQNLCEPCLIQYHTEQSERVRGQSVKDPIMTVDASNRYGMAAACLCEYFSTGRPLDVTDPMHTVTTRERECLTLAHLAHFKGQDKGQHPMEPLMTITAQDGQFADVRTTVAKFENGENVGHWPEVRKLLNEYCDYGIMDNEILLLRIRGVDYFIYDIALRMLAPKELYRAMGFPPDYIIDKDYRGNTYGRSKQVARCGNAVCPPIAKAVVQANLPEWCTEKIETMHELEDVVAGT